MSVWDESKPSSVEPVIPLCSHFSSELSAKGCDVSFQFQTV